MEIEGKVAVVSGGASGIGRAAVLALAEREAKVVVADVDVRAGGQIGWSTRPKTHEH
jgi:NAD(P)-dependent dehydrogenase (short-subunit alcohol dehydrogenase family)